MGDSTQLSDNCPHCFALAHFIAAPTWVFLRERLPDGVIVLPSAHFSSHILLPPLRRPRDPADMRLAGCAPPRRAGGGRKESPPARPPRPVTACAQRLRHLSGLRRLPSVRLALAGTTHARVSKRCDGIEQLRSGLGVGRTA